jgi:hypothetical protein
MNHRPRFRLEFSDATFEFVLMASGFLSLRRDLAINIIPYYGPSVPPLHAGDFVIWCNLRLIEFAFLLCRSGHF